MRTQASWSAAKKILAVRLDALGDVLMTTPALRALKETDPGRSITLLTSPSGAAAAPFIPEIDDAIVYECPWMKAAGPRSDSLLDVVMIERLRAQKFDAAVIFTVFSQNPLPAAMLCYLADIPLRLAHCRENPYQLLTNWVADPEPQQGIRHEVRRQLDLVSTVGAHTLDERMSFRVSERASQTVLGQLDEIGIDPESPWVVVHPGATAPSRRYPPEGFARAANLLAQNLNCPVVFTGGKDEREIVEGIRREMSAPSWSLAGELTLEELGALIQAAPLLIANNTGPVHMAAALGTPVVDLYALTNPQHTPWLVPHRTLNHDVPCRQCFKSVCPEGHHHCLRLVTPESIVDAAAELLGFEDSPRTKPWASRGFVHSGDVVPVEFLADPFFSFRP